MKVILVGAGIGDSELITVKGAKALACADIIVYDRLISTELLDLAKDDAEKIYVGKGKGLHTIEQECINELLYEKAKTGKTVVRLKGGDPYVFGHGKEEYQYLKERGVTVEVIPGLTSALAGLTYAGISVTDREKARSFSIFTGSFKHGPCDYNWPAVAASDGAKIFLMGLSQTSHISNSLINAGMAPETPACIIENAGYPYQRSFTCTLETLEITKQTNTIQSPAIIVIGDIVRDRELFNFFEKLHC